MLNALFPEMFGNSNNGTNLSSGGKPEQLLGNDRLALSEFSQVPGKVTQSEVDKIASKAGEIEANSALMKVWSEQALSAQQAALTNLDIRLNHAQASMRNEQQYRKKVSKHGKNVLEHRIDVSATRANLDGYQQALNNANETISI